MEAAVKPSAMLNVADISSHYDDFAWAYRLPPQTSGGIGDSGRRNCRPTPVIKRVVGRATMRRPADPT